MLKLHKLMKAPALARYCPSLECPIKVAIKPKTTKIAQSPANVRAYGLTIVRHSRLKQKLIQWNGNRIHNYRISVSKKRQWRQIKKIGHATQNAPKSPWKPWLPTKKKIVSERKIKKWNIYNFWVADLKMSSDSNFDHFLCT